MKRKLKITRILVLIAFAIYAGSLFLPYVKINDGRVILGMEWGLEFLSPLALIILILYFLEHSTLTIWLMLSFVILFVGMNLYSELLLLTAVNGGVITLLIGYPLLLISNLFLLVISIIKFRIPPLKKHPKNDILDDFLTQSSDLTK